MPRNTLTEFLAETDLLVEYCARSDESDKSWCVRRGHVLLFTDNDINTALAFAKRVADEQGSHAWLLSPVEAIQIDFSPR